MTKKTSYKVIAIEDEPDGTFKITAEDKNGRWFVFSGCYSKGYNLESNKNLIVESIELKNICSGS